MNQPAELQKHLASSQEGELKLFMRLLRRAIRQPSSVPYRLDFFRRLLLIPIIFDVVVTIAQFRDLKRVKAIKTPKLEIQRDLDNDEVLKANYTHNSITTWSKKVTSNRQLENYFQVLALFQKDVRSERLLLVGPRTFFELYLAWLHGYSWKNIFAIDLYSTNPKIQVMNMEKTSFPDNEFDAVMMGHVLAYSRIPEVVCKEVSRILKPGGRLVVDVVYSPESKWPAEQNRGNFWKTMMVGAGLEIYFCRSRSKTNRNGEKLTSHLLGLKKVDRSETLFDKIDL